MLDVGNAVPDSCSGELSYELGTLQHGLVTSMWDRINGNTGVRYRGEMRQVYGGRKLRAVSQSGGLSRRLDNVSVLFDLPGIMLESENDFLTLSYVSWKNLTCFKRRKWPWYSWLEKMLKFATWLLSLWFFTSHLSFTFSQWWTFIYNKNKELVPIGLPLSTQKTNHRKNKKGSECSTSMWTLVISGVLPNFGKSRTTT